MAEDEPLTGAIDSIKPWTIKSISSEVRDIAIIAARQENLTVGQWLERVIRAAVGQVSNPSDSPRAAQLTRAVDLVAKLAESGAPIDVASPLYAAIRREFKIATPRQRALPAPDAEAA